MKWEREAGRGKRTHVQSGWMSRVLLTLIVRIEQHVDGLRRNAHPPPPPLNRKNKAK